MKIDMRLGVNLMNKNVLKEKKEKVTDQGVEIEVIVIDDRGKIIC